MSSEISAEAQKVRDALAERGIETPMILPKQGKRQRRDEIEKKMREVLSLMKVSEMVLVDDVTLTSTCEHHFVTIDGKVSVAYYPKKWVIGLSKINRVVAFFAQRPQVQERLTEQILLAFQTILETEDVAVYVRATHFCVKCRGIKDANSCTITSAFGGVFLEDRETRKEFLTLINK